MYHSINEFQNHYVYGSLMLLGSYFLWMKYFLSKIFSKNEVMLKMFAMMRLNIRQNLTKLSKAFEDSV